MTLEKNTYTTSNYIAAPIDEVTAYVANGMSLNEYTLFSRMHEQVDSTTWLGTASGYQAGLYYHVVQRDLGRIKVVEWHCGAEYGVYHHVYPMLTLAPDYFGSEEVGTYYHWISFVDPERATAMITQGLPTVHRSEARSLKAQLERRHGHTKPVACRLRLDAHTIYVEATVAQVSDYLADSRHLTDWAYLMSRDGTQLRDDYGNPIDIKLTRHDLDGYSIIEHDTSYAEGMVRAPFLIIPTAYAFGQPSATGVILHRLSSWPFAGERAFGKVSPDDYNTEAINAKRVIEGRVGNRAAYARGCSYSPAAKPE